MSIGTLGDPILPSTCSYAATFYHFPNHKIKLYDTFEKAISSLKKKEIDNVVIPSAYPKINPIIMDNQLECIDTFLYRIPDLVLAASLKSESSTTFNTLYYHPATLSLLNTINKNFKFHKQQTVRSNTESAYKASSDENSICITNQLCIAPNHLKVLQIIKPSFSMPFIVFKTKEI